MKRGYWVIEDAVYASKRRPWPKEYVVASIAESEALGDYREWWFSDQWLFVRRRWVQDKSILETIIRTWREEMTMAHIRTREATHYWRGCLMKRLSRSKHVPASDRKEE